METEGESLEPVEERKPQGLVNPLEDPDLVIPESKPTKERRHGNRDPYPEHARTDLASEFGAQCINLDRQRRVKTKKGSFNCGERLALQGARPDNVNKK